MNKFQSCNTKEEIMEKILKEGGNLEASERSLQLGFVDESIKFYLLSQQENFLNILQQQTYQLEGISNANKTAGYAMVEASENNKTAAQQMVYNANSFEESSRRIMNSMNR